MVTSEYFIVYLNLFDWSIMSPLQMCLFTIWLENFNFHVYVDVKPFIFFLVEQHLSRISADILRFPQQGKNQNNKNEKK